MKAKRHGRRRRKWQRMGGTEGTGWEQQVWVQSALWRCGVRGHWRAVLCIFFIGEIGSHSCGDGGVEALAACSGQVGRA